LRFVRIQNTGSPYTKHWQSVYKTLAVRIQNTGSFTLKTRFFRFFSIEKTFFRGIFLAYLSLIVYAPPFFSGIFRGIWAAWLHNSGAFPGITEQKARFPRCNLLFLMALCAFFGGSWWWLVPYFSIQKGGAGGAGRMGSPWLVAWASSSDISGMAGQSGRLVSGIERGAFGNMKNSLHPLVNERKIIFTCYSAPWLSSA